MSLLLPAEATTVERWTSRLNACENTKEEPLLALLVDKWGGLSGDRSNSMYAWTFATTVVWPPATLWFAYKFLLFTFMVIPS